MTDKEFAVEHGWVESYGRIYRPSESETGSVVFASSWEDAAELSREVERLMENGGFSHAR